MHTVHCMSRSAPQPRMMCSTTVYKRHTTLYTKVKTLPFSREEHGSVRLCRPLRRAHLRADTITHVHAAGMCAARWRATSPQRRRRSLHTGDKVSGAPQSPPERQLRTQRKAQRRRVAHGGMAQNMSQVWLRAIRMTGLSHTCPRSRRGTASRACCGAGQSASEDNASGA